MIHLRWVLHPILTSFPILLVISYVTSVTAQDAAKPTTADSSTTTTQEATTSPQALEPQRTSFIRDLWKGVFNDIGGKPGAPPLDASQTGATAAGGAITKHLPPFMRQVIDKYNVRAAIIGDFAYETLDARDLENEDLQHALMRELEFGISADLASTVRADLIYSIERDGKRYHSGFEEAYVTFLSLPLDFQARLGKFKAAFGKANQLHTHARPWIDNPAPEENFFGESLTGSGISLSHLVPNPWNVYSEVIFQAIHLNAGSTAASQNARGWTELVHWKNVFDLNPESTLEVGLSAANIEQRRGGNTTAEGLDITYKWRPAEQGLYRSIVWMNELYVLQNDVETKEEKNDFWGAYSSFEYQFARRWSAGLRVDFSQVPEQTSNQFGVAPFITFRQTERIFYRLQFNHTENDPDHEGGASNDVRLQFDVSLGSHAPHTY